MLLQSTARCIRYQQGSAGSQRSAPHSDWVHFCCQMGCESEGERLIKVLKPNPHLPSHSVTFVLVAVALQVQLLLSCARRQGGDFATRGSGHDAGRGQVWQHLCQKYSASRKGEHVKSLYAGTYLILPSYFRQMCLVKENNL